MRTGPRIYNLFPLLAGPIPRWREHLDRIAGMGFDWIYLNPIHYPGFSGSLYAVKDPERLHPLLEEGTGGDPISALRAFLEEARNRGIRVMFDLVANHTARDALLVERHPEWYARDEKGIRSPFAVDPDDASKVTVWGDLAELDYENPRAREGLIGYFSAYVKRQLELGFAGFRCDAAYKVPPEVWSRLLGAARAVRPDAVFFAETLGCTLEEVAATAGGGFDYLFNSSKWWDFRQGWALEQYESHRHIAPSISFPETHDTPRLAAESGGRLEVLRLRYLFAAFFSAGIMMPVGYEYAFRRPLHVVKTRPEDWERTGVDLTGFIAAANRMKARCPVLNEEGPMTLLPQRRPGIPASGPAAESTPTDPVVRLLKRSERSGDRALAWIHPEEGEVEAPVAEATAALGAEAGDITVLLSSAGQGPAPDIGAPLRAREIRILYKG